MRALPLVVLLAAIPVGPEAPAEASKHRATPKVSKVGPRRPAPKAPKAPPKAPPTPEADGDEPVPPIDPYELAEQDLKRRREALPKPPSDEPAAYDRWYKRLPLSTRRTIEKFCLDRPVDYEESCGGIGIHRIPRPPSLMRVGGFEKHAIWERNLDPLQRAHYAKYCKGEAGGEGGNGYSQLCGGTPLVISFDNRPIEFVASKAPFELYPGDATMTVDWPTAATPWLALDRDGDGAITSGAELFGDATVLPNGARAKHGFEALAALDANGDGKLDRADPQFAALLLWADRDGDRKSSPDELMPASRMIDSIALGYTFVGRCDARGNCEGERASVSWHDAAGGPPKTGTVVDVYLRFQ